MILSRRRDGYGAWSGAGLESHASKQASIIAFMPLRRSSKSPAMYVSQSTGGTNTSQITDTERARSTRIALWRHVTNHARGARLYGVPAKATVFACGLTQVQDPVALHSARVRLEDRQI